jgi:hypothetical protein
MRILQLRKRWLSSSLTTWISFSSIGQWVTPRVSLRSIMLLCVSQPPTYNLAKLTCTYLDLETNGRTCSAKPRDTLYWHLEL